MAKKLLEELNKLEDLINEEQETIEKKDAEVEANVIPGTLKEDWETILQDNLSIIDASHIEKNAILPLINGLIK